MVLKEPAALAADGGEAGAHAPLEVPENTGPDIQPKRVVYRHERAEQDVQKACDEAPVAIPDAASEIMRMKINRWMSG